MPPTSKIHRQKLLYIPQIYRLWIMEKRLWCMKRFSNDKIYKDEDIMNKKKIFFCAFIRSRPYNSAKKCS